MDARGRLVRAATAGAAPVSRSGRQPVGKTVYSGVFPIQLRSSNWNMVTRRTGGAAHCSTQNASSPKAGHAILNRGPLHHDVPRHRNGHDPDWLSGSLRRAVRVTAPSRLKAPTMRWARTPGMRRIAGSTGTSGPQPDGPAIETGGPFTAGAAHRERQESRHGPRMRHGVGQRWKTAAGRRLSRRHGSARAPERSLVSVPDPPGTGLTLMPNSGCCIRTYLCADLHITTVTTIVNSALLSFV